MRWTCVGLVSAMLGVLGCGRTTTNDDNPPSGIGEGGTGTTTASATTKSSRADSVAATAVSASAGGAVGSVSSSMASVTTGAAGAGSDPVDELECNAPYLATPEEWAQRLERLLWGTDGTRLSEALASGELDLSDGADVRAHAVTMLNDAELGRVGLPSFVKAWLDLDETRLSLSDELLASTLESTDRTLDAMIFAEPAPLSVFYSGDWAVVDELLADYYGTEAPAGEWGVATLPEPRQAGLLGQHFWLNATAHPSYRGTVLSNALRCILIPSPPTSDPVRENRRTDVTRREGYLQGVAPAECAVCHFWIAPLGLPFEHFDGWGDFRSEDNGFPVDASGGIPDTEIEVDGARELGSVFANELAPETEHCVARQVVAYSLGNPGAVQSSVFDELECFERLNAELVELETPSFLEWIVTLVGSPVFLSEYSE